MAGGFGRRHAVEDLQAAVQRRHLGDDARGRGRILGYQRAGQAALPLGGQRQGFVDAVVGHQRADGAEGLDVVRSVALRIARQQQRGLEERALAHTLAHRRKAGVAAAEHHLGTLAQRGHALGHVGLLRLAGQRAHAHVLQARIAHGGLGQALLEFGGDGVDLVSRHQRAADGGAFLARLLRHLARHFLDEQVELFVVGRHVGRQDGAVQRVGLGVEGNALGHQVGRHAQLGRRVGRAGEGDGIAHIQPVHQVARAADDELQRALGQDAGVVDQAHQLLGEKAGGRGRLADAGHAGQEGGREFLQQAPHGEVEGIDVYRHAAARHQHVRAGEGASLAQRHLRAFVPQVAGRGQLLGHAGVGEQRARAALDVDPAVGARGAGVERQRVHLLLALAQVLGQGLQHAGALLEVGLAHGGEARGAGVVQRLAEVDGIVVRVRDHRAVDGAAQRLRGLAADPAAGDVALKLGHGKSP